MNQPCPKCASTSDRTFLWQTFANGTTHIREHCSACKAYIRYAKQTPDVLQRAGPPPSAPRRKPSEGGLFGPLSDEKGGATLKTDASIGRVPKRPAGETHNPVDPDKQCWWCFMFFGPSRPFTGVLWSGHRLCDRCAVTIDAKRGA